MFKNLNPYSRKSIRLLSIIHLLTISIVSIVAEPRLFAVLASGGVGISISMILMIPDTYKDWKMSGRIAWVTFFASVSSAVTLSLLGRLSLAAVIFPFLSVVPMTVCITLRSFWMMRDICYLSTKVSGWEILLCVMKCCFMLFYIIALLSVYSYAVIRKTSFGWFSLIPLALSLGLFALVYVRCITSGPIISFTSSGVPVCEKDIESSAYLPESARSNYKQMYDKICRVIETSKMYLDPSCSMTDLVAEVASNKSYVSKLVNVCTGLNFNQFINRYRVDYARDQFLRNPELKVKDLALMSGFRSEVTFIMAFKLFYTDTPGLWCKDVKAQMVASRPLSSPSVQVQ